MKLKNKKEYHYKGKVYDLEIDSKDHSYNIEGAVVHNSAGGSLLLYLLGITGLDPIKHKLLFQRFLSRGRRAKLQI